MAATEAESKRDDTPPVVSKPNPTPLSIFGETWEDIFDMIQKQPALPLEVQVAVRSTIISMQLAELLFFLRKLKIPAWLLKT
jgi:hypothetical protein